MDPVAIPSPHSYRRKSWLAKSLGETLQWEPRPQVIQVGFPTHMICSLSQLLILCNLLPLCGPQFLAPQGGF